MLGDQTIYAVLAEAKPNQQEQLKFKREELRKYFPSGYTEEQMCRDIIKGLELPVSEKERACNRLDYRLLMAERVGFEPTVP